MMITTGAPPTFVALAPAQPNEFASLYALDNYGQVWQLVRRDLGQKSFPDDSLMLVWEVVAAPAITKGEPTP